MREVQNLLKEVHNLLSSLMTEAHILMEVPASLSIQRQLEGTASEEEVWIPGPSAEEQKSVQKRRGGEPMSWEN